MARRSCSSSLLICILILALYLLLQYLLKPSDSNQFPIPVPPGGAQSFQPSFSDDANKVVTWTIVDSAQKSGNVVKRVNYAVGSRRTTGTINEGSIVATDQTTVSLSSPNADQVIISNTDSSGTTLTCPANFQGPCTSTAFNWLVYGQSTSNTDLGYVLLPSGETAVRIDQKESTPFAVGTGLFQPCTSSTTVGALTITEGKGTIGQLTIYYDDGSANLASVMSDVKTSVFQPVKSGVFPIPGDRYVAIPTLNNTPSPTVTLYGFNSAGPSVDALKTWSNLVLADEILLGFSNGGLGYSRFAIWYDSTPDAKADVLAVLYLAQPSGSDPIWRVNFYGADGSNVPIRGPITVAPTVNQLITGIDISDPPNLPVTLSTSAPIVFTSIPTENQGTTAIATSVTFTF